ncbi:hypothetical protein ACLI4R_09390 [Natrialbaceae archaeon A-chndr2]
MSQTDTSKTAEFLKNHPRLIGMMFAAMILLSQAGTVVAGGNSSTTGGI